MNEIGEKNAVMKIGEPSSEPLYQIKQLLHGECTDQTLAAEKELSTLKMSSILLAKKYLERLVDQTRQLEKFETKFYEAMDDALENDSANIMLITTAMESLTKLITSSQQMVSSVLKDDRMQSIVITNTTNITPDGGSSEIMDAASRDAVRNLAESLLAQLSVVASEDIIDVEPTETTEGDDGV